MTSPYALSLGLGLTSSAYFLHANLGAASFGVVPLVSSRKEREAVQIDERKAVREFPSPLGSEVQAEKRQQRTSMMSGILQQHQSQLRRGPALSISSNSSSSSPGSTPSLSRSSSTSSSCSLSSTSSTPSTTSESYFSCADTPSAAHASSTTRTPWHFEEAPPSPNGRPASPSILPTDVAAHQHKFGHRYHLHSHHSHAQGEESTTPPVIAFAAPKRSITSSNRRRRARSNSAPFPDHAEFHLMFGRVD